jgi:hypothetical protein
MIASIRYLDALWRQPPIANPYRACCLFEYLGQSPEVIHAIDIELDGVALSLWGEALVAMAVEDFLPDPVRLFLVVFIMAMIGVVGVLFPLQSIASIQVSMHPVCARVIERAQRASSSQQQRP